MADAVAMVAPVAAAKCFRGHRLVSRGDIIVATLMAKVMAKTMAATGETGDNTKRSNHLPEWWNRQTRGTQNRGPLSGDMVSCVPVRVVSLVKHPGLLRCRLSVRRCTTSHMMAN